MFIQVFEKPVMDEEPATYYINPICIRYIKPGKEEWIIGLDRYEIYVNPSEGERVRKTADIILS